VPILDDFLIFGRVCGIEQNPMANASSAFKVRYRPECSRQRRPRVAHDAAPLCLRAMHGTHLPVEPSGLLQRWHARLRGSLTTFSDSPSKGCVRVSDLSECPNPGLVSESEVSCELRFWST
jgi:hypothetical protein